MSPFILATMLLCVLLPLSCAVALWVLLHTREEATLGEAAEALAATLRSIFRKRP